MNKSLAIRLCALLLGLMMAAGVLTACSFLIGGPDVVLTDPATDPITDPATDPITEPDTTAEETTEEATVPEETTLPETTEEETTEEATTLPETTEEVTTEPVTTEPPAPAVEPWQIVLVNPWNPLPEDHKIELKTVTGKYKMDARCVDAVKQMLADCKAAGFTPYVCSAYRTTADQEYLFEKKVTSFKNKGYSEAKARELAAKETAVPGTSEHQLGLAVDILDIDRPWLDEAQANMPAQKWLMANCHKYGFILRYPKGTTDITGIIYEPWHYRYVGVELATEIMTKGITLEEYLGMVASSEDTKVPPPMPETEPAPETTVEPETTEAPVFDEPSVETDAPVMMAPPKPETPWNLVLVNRYYTVPEDLDIVLVQIAGGHTVDDRIVEALEQMLSDCRTAGHTPYVCDGYRTNDDQAYILDQRIQKYINKGYPEEQARELALKEAALPGTSEHQLGLAVDILCTSRPWADTAQENTATQQWLMANCHKYGFILRYTKDKSDITGYIYEPWHYRYVGVEAANEIVSRGITLEEYLGKVGAP